MSGKFSWTRFGLHFVPLFAVALITWALFGVLRTGMAHLFPGVIVAALWGTVGTYIALRTSRQRDLRGRDAVEDYAVRQVERTMSRTGTPFAIRISRSRTGHPVAGD